MALLSGLGVVLLVHWVRLAWAEPGRLILRVRTNRRPGSAQARSTVVECRVACPCRSRPAGEYLHEPMPFARRDSLAGKLLQKQKARTPVGAGLPANVRLR